MGLSLSYKGAVILFVYTCRDSSGKVGVDLVIYSSAKSEDLTSYYSRLETLLADESAMDNTLKPLRVSRKSVTVRSASKFSSVANETETISREKKIASD